MGYCTQCDATWFDGDPRKMCDCEELIMCNACTTCLPESEMETIGHVHYCPDCYQNSIEEEHEITGGLTPVNSINSIFIHFQI